MSISRSHRDDLLDLILGVDPPPFAILLRAAAPWSNRPAAEPQAELMIGDVSEYTRLADLPAGDPDASPVLAIVPFRQLAERGFETVDDGAPLLGLRIRRRARISLTTLLARLPGGPGPFEETGYDLPDDAYRQLVTDVLEQEIAAGEGSNFVIHRAVTGRVELPPAQAALGAAARLLTREQHTYWTFVVHTPASPWSAPPPSGT